MGEATENWKKALHSPGAASLTVLKNFFASIEWWKFVPDQSIFSSGADSGNKLNAAIRSTAGEAVIAYLSSSTTVSLNMNRITAGKSVRAVWIDPKTGNEIVIGDFPNEQTQSFTTPAGWEDAVLTLKAQR